LIGLAVFAAAVGVLRIEFRSIGWDRLRLEIATLPRRQLALAAALTALNYLLLTGYDLLAFAYIGRRLSPIRIAFTSLVAFAVSNGVGLPTISGASIRYRFYTRWGLTPDELSRIVFAYSVTFWLGLLTLGGLSLATTSLAGVTTMRGIRGAAPAGWLLMA